MSKTGTSELREILAASELIRSRDEVEAALDAMAEELNDLCQGDDWLVLVVMNGGLMPAAWLMERFTFFFELDYIHATRYRGATVGNELHWQAHPHTPLKGRKILLLDDILDEGITLQQIIEHCRESGALEVQAAVLVRKDHGRNIGIEADIVGMNVPDRYVFGCGMDYREHFRHLPEVRALARDNSDNS
ncbi:MAG: hypoxanthine-guanine phosphoribosyltransferase [Gammaproteobacteria bacterium]|nr:hypoxanthine-guanine phosphoribosyltransferase [Gammaproteobacteria bacterium]